MSRSEFTKPTRRLALARSGHKCEAAGPRYGLLENERCNAPLDQGVIFDHDDPDANSKDNSLENCRCICPGCNKFKTFKTDIPMIAKTLRQQDKDKGITKPKSPWPKRRMNGPRIDNTKHLDRDDDLPDGFGESQW